MRRSRVGKHSWVCLHPLGSRVGYSPRLRSGLSADAPPICHSPPALAASPTHIPTHAHQTGTPASCGLPGWKRLSSSCVFGSTPSQALSQGGLGTTRERPRASERRASWRGGGGRLGSEEGGWQVGRGVGTSRRRPRASAVRASWREETRQERGGLSRRVGTTRWASCCRYAAPRYVPSPPQP